MLQRQIRARVLDDHLMQAAIVSNPHKDPDDQKEFVEGLLKQRRWYRPEPEAPAETDFAALDALKDSLQKQSKLIRAK